ncbi:MAG: PEP-CTERM sorting domain-containing protein [Gammaproteobacteria bacterium]|nr:PEP-CTERM sorting domain-containing protein [Gammaproteobacteria bacterium]
MTSCTARFLAVLIASTGAGPGPAHAAATLPDFGAATFVPGAAVDHPYFPLLDNLTRIYVGEKNEGGEIVTERFELTVLGAGPTILGVATTARRDRAYEDDLLVEETLDYYAQDTAGNVWYFGEDVTNYVYDDDDNLVSTHNASAWLAGQNSALPGFAMPGALTPAFNYYQEFAPFDAALDEGTVLAVGVELSLGIGDFDDVLVIYETSALDPDAREFKYYARDLGLVFVEEGLSVDLSEADFSIELVSTVPVPAALWLMGPALAGLCLRRRPSDDLARVALAV